ncbi:ABC transporter permease [Amphibacillus indicireducens]|uniref:MacB-like periplasmic core domain-containing protein n=1 Tax=Amphibacillus indicireducens TaxID=1076330 RepID=A0ABP7VXR3_9BACI
MHFVRRGFIGMMRRKGKSLILLAVLFILGNLIAGAISIQQATNNVEYNIRERLGAAIVIEVDYKPIDALSEEERVKVETGDISLESIQQVGELPYVKYYDYYTYFGLGSKSLKYYFGQDVDQAAAEGVEIDFGMKGVNYPHILDFQEGKGNLIDGRTFSQDEIDNGSSVTLISEKLATLNNLHVGDTIILNNEVYSYDLDTYEEELFSSRDLVLEIIGIFEVLAVKDDIEFDFGQGTINWEDTLVQNTIYVPNQIIFNEADFDWEETKKAIPEFADTMTENPHIGNYRTMYVLESHQYIDAFKQEADPLLPPYYHVVGSGDH